MSSTSGGIINQALADLGVIRPGETVSATVTADCLLRLNQRLSAHSIEQLMAQTHVHTQYALQNGVVRYSMGVGGTFFTSSRPLKVTGWRANYGNFFSAGPILTFDELQAASRDSLGSTTSIPSAVGADTAYPWINVGVFPPPSSAAGTLELSYWAALTQFISSTDVVSLPDGWEDFLHTDLAVALLPRYGRQGFDPTVLLANAQTAKAKIADLNRSTQTPAAA